MNVTNCRFQIAATGAGQFPRDGFPEIAFLGRSNVGKSSLINRLLGVRSLARTSKTPGRTREIHFYRVNDRIFFVDLPGYGYARVPRPQRQQWKGLVESYLAPGRPRLAVQLMDARHEPTDLDLQLLEWLRTAGVRHRVVLTKADKLSGNQRRQALAQAATRLALPPGVQPLAVSAMTGDGLAALWRDIDEAIAGHPPGQAPVERMHRSGGGPGERDGPERPGPSRMA
jgi:GTP-binding protein